jgi:hypothetical protein
MSRIRTYLALSHLLALFVRREQVHIQHKQIPPHIHHLLDGISSRLPGGRTPNLATREVGHGPGALGEACSKNA